MSREYKQVKYRADAGRFDGNLNKMSADGWEVESIDRVEDVFLVTYSRALPEKYKTVTCRPLALERHLAENSDHELISIIGHDKVTGSGSTGSSTYAGVYGSSSTSTETFFTLVWALRPGIERASRDRAARRRTSTFMPRG